MPFEAVVFDMDGTLVEATLDFAAVRAELDVPADAGIFETILAMPARAAADALRRLEDMELAGAARARLNDGAVEVLAAVRAAGLKTALLTRNNRQAMETVLRRFDLAFDLAWSREDGAVKPSPEAVLRACDSLGVRPGRTACVGDFRYDVEAANAAGTVSILLVRPDSVPPFAASAARVVHSLRELPAILGI